MGAELVDCVEILQELGENVSRKKKTAKGEILLELKKAQTCGTEGYRGEMEKYWEIIHKLER